MEAKNYFKKLEPWSKLKFRAARGGAVTVMTNALSFGIQMVGTIILARLLTPRDFGLVTMVTTFSLFLQTFVTGFTESTIQRETISHGELSNLFWINIGLSSSLTLLFWLASPFIAWLYHEPALKAISAAVAFSIVASSLGTQHRALLQRNMKFGLVSWNGVVARGMSLVVAIVAAWMGWGYWALITSVLLLPFIEGVGAWVCCGWRPGLPSRGADVRPMIRFGLNTYGYWGANYITRNLDNLLVGWCYGSGSLGGYKKAYDLFALPVNQLSMPLTNVALASLSRLRDDPDRYRRNYGKAICFLAFIGMGLSAMLTLAGKDLVRLVLGAQWDEAGRIFTYFAPGIGIMLLYNTIGWLHLSSGGADRWFRWGLFEMVVTATLFVIGLSFGTRGVALAWTCSLCLLAGPGLSYAGRPFRLSLLSVLSVAWRYVLAAIVAGLLCWFLLHSPGALALFFSALSSIVRVLTLILLFTSFYVGLLLLFPFSSTFGPIWDILKLLVPQSLISVLMRKRSSLVHVIENRE